MRTFCKIYVQLLLTILIFCVMAGTWTETAFAVQNNLGKATLNARVDVGKFQLLASLAYSSTEQLAANSSNNTVTQSPPSKITTSGLQIEQVIEGIDYQTCLSSTPSPQIAASPNHIMETTNAYARIFTKAGALISSFSLNDLFNVTEGGFFDPQVFYDAMSGRWFVSGDYGHNGTEIPYIAVSATDDPTGTWTVYNTNFDSSFIDQPSIGISNDKLVILAYDMENQRLQALIYDKSALLAGSPAPPFQSYYPAVYNYNIFPAKMLGPSSTLYMAGISINYTTGQYYANLFTITGTVPNASVDVTSLPLQVTPYRQPPQGIGQMQPGTNQAITVAEGFPWSIAWNNGKLWLSENEFCIPQGDTQYRWCILLAQLDTDTNTVQQSFFFGSKGYYFFYPAITIDKSGNMVTVFGYSSPMAYPSLAVTGQAAGAQPNTLSPFMAVKSGSAASGGNYGHYFGAARDPIDPTLVWVTGEYQPTSTFSTAIAAIRTPGPSVFATNAGGAQVTDTTGNVFKADIYNSGGFTASTASAIIGTTDPKLYQSERYGNFSYNIPLANGSYNVTLKFAEIYWDAAGRRVFNVSMQGAQVISNLDIFSKVGKNAAYDVNVPVTVSNGNLKIVFTTVSDNAKVSAIFVSAAGETPVIETYSISGTVRTASNPLPGVAIALSQNGTTVGTTTTESNGYYSFSSLYNGSYSITPTLTGYSFNPSSIVTSINAANVTGQDFSAVPNTTSNVIFATNAGGGQYTDASGNVYKADTNYSGGHYASTTSAISGTSDDALYQSERFGNISYNIPLANGNYIVKLKFAEIYWSVPGKRVFNVYMQGNKEISNLDIFSKVGKNAAYDVDVPVSVTNGMLNIVFSSVADYAKVSAIFITSGSAGPPVIALKPASLTFSATVGTNPANQNVEISNGGGGTLNWTATADPTAPAWLSVSPASGTGNGNLTVSVNTAGLTPGTYTKVITVSDAEASNTPQTLNVTLTVNATNNVVFATNSGGGRYTDLTEVVYQADTGYSGGYKASTAAAISGTSDDTLYQSERYGNFSYNIPLANGNYTVTLKFAEIYWAAAGQRVFNVSMQGTNVISNLDIFSKVGKNAAYDVSKTVSVTNGFLTINFSSVADWAKVSAIIVTSQ